MAVKEEHFWENQEKTRIENAIAERKNAVAQQDRLKRMYADRDAYMDQLKAERKSLYEEKLARFNDMLEIEKKKRLAQRVIERRKERRDKWLAEREAEKQRKLEELRRIEEERKAAEAEKRRKEREAENEKLAKIAAIQAARDAELEEKARLKKEKEREEMRENRDRERVIAPAAQESNWRTRGSETGRSETSGGTRDQPQQSLTGSAWRSRTMVEGEKREKEKQQWRRDIPRDENRGRDENRPRVDENRGRDENRTPRDENRGARDERSKDTGGWRDQPKESGKYNVNFLKNSY